MEHFDEAIKLDEDFSAAAFAGKAWLLLKGRERIIVSNNQIQGYKQQALELLKKSLTLLNDEMASLSATLQILQLANTDTKSDLFLQLVYKTNILGSYVNCLENTAKVTKQSLLIFDITIIQIDHSYFSKSKKLEFLAGTSYFDMDKNKLSEIKDKMNLGKQFEITFNDLSLIKKTKDQAIETIEAGFSNFILNEDYNNISIYLLDLDSQILQQMLSPDIEVKDLNKEEALAQLQDKFFFLSRHLLPIQFQPNSCLINLTVKDNNKVLCEHNNLELSKVIDIIKNNQNDGSSFNLNFKNINEISKSLNQELSNQALILEFQNLDLNAVRKKIVDIKYNNISIEIYGKKDQLQAVMNLFKDPKVNKVQLLNYGKDNNIVDISYLVKEINEKLNKSQENSFCLKLENLNKEQINQILNVCENAIFTISFKYLIPFENINKLREGKINVIFDKLEKNHSIKLISLLRKQNLDFSLKFKNLSYDQFNKLIQNAQLDQENIEITKIRNLNQLFNNETQLTLELSEFALRGIYYLFEINEKGFIPWLNVGIIFLLAGIQIGAGIYLKSTGFGVMIGQALITEGASDILNGIRIIQTRKFNWKDYMIQKSISLLISAVSFGFQSINNQTNTIYNAAKTEIYEQEAIQIAKNGKIVTKVIAETGKKLMQFNQLKQAAFEIGEHGVREVLNNISHSLCNLGIEQFKPQIFGFIQKQVKKKFYNQNLNNLIRKMYWLDNLSKSNNYNQKIQDIIIEITNPQNSFLKRTWESIGLPLCKGVLSDKSQLESNLGMLVRIGGTIKGIKEIFILIDQICDQLLKKLSQISYDELKISQLLSKYCQIEQSDSNQIVEILKKEDIILVQEIDHKNNLEYVNPSTYEIDSNIYLSMQKQIKSFNEIDFGIYQKYKDSVNTFLKQLSEGTSSIKIEEITPVITLISNQVTQQMISILNQQIIQPWSSYGIGILTAKISNSIQNNMIKKEIIKDIDYQKKKLENLKENENLTQEQQLEINEIENYIQKRYDELKQQQTYSKQIQGEFNKQINHQNQRANISITIKELVSCANCIIEVLPNEYKQGTVFKDILSLQQIYTMDQILKPFLNIFWKIIQIKIDNILELEQKRTSLYKKTENIKISKDTINLASLIYEEDYQQKMEEKGFKVIQKIDSWITQKYGIVAAFIQKNHKIYIATQGTNLKNIQTILAQIILDIKIGVGLSNEEAINAFSDWILRAIHNLNLDQSHIEGVGHSLGGYLIISAAIKIKQFFQRVVSFDSPRLEDKMINKYGEPNFEIINFQSSIIGVINYNSDHKNIKLIQIPKSNQNELEKLEEKNCLDFLKSFFFDVCQIIFLNQLGQDICQKVFQFICSNVFKEKGEFLKIYEKASEYFSFLITNYKCHIMEYIEKNLDQYLEI